MRSKIIPENIPTHGASVSLRNRTPQTMLFDRWVNGDLLARNSG